MVEGELERARMTGDVAVEFPLEGRRVWVAGHTGMVGAAMVRRLAQEGCEILAIDRRGMDLRRQKDVEGWLAANRPDVVVLAAATVGGIGANAARPAEFIYDNLAIAQNVIDGAWKAGVERLLFLGSSCIYPKMAPQPIPESALMTGPLEPTNEAYAVAKIAGVKLAQAYRAQYGASYISAMPTNLYGPGDRFDEAEGHVAPALMLRMLRARVEGEREVSVWGTGEPLREFLHVGDLADACATLLKQYDGETPINVGGGDEVSIRDLAAVIARVVGFEGRIRFDASKPDGTPRKLVDSAQIRALGWRPSFDLETGLRDAYFWLQAHRPDLMRPDIAA